MRWRPSIRPNCWRRWPARAETVKEGTASVAGLIDDASARISAALGLEKREARLDARVLAAFAWDVAPAWLIAHDTDPLTETQTAQFETLLTRRLSGEPVAHLTG